MRRIAVRNAAVIYDDLRTNRRWEANRVDASIERNLQGLAGDVRDTLEFLFRRGGGDARAGRISGSRGRG